MGQKVSPHGFRVGVIQDWDSKWFASKQDFSDNLVEDNKIRTFLKKELYAADGENRVLCRYEGQNARVCGGGPEAESGGRRRRIRRGRGDRVEHADQRVVTIRGLSPWAAVRNRSRTARDVVRPRNSR